MAYVKNGWLSFIRCGVASTQLKAAWREETVPFGVRRDTKMILTGLPIPFTYSYTIAIIWFKSGNGGNSPAESRTWGWIAAAGRLMKGVCNNA
jgi:hypothetical protein